MSLQVWLPLNGNLENQGLFNVNTQNLKSSTFTTGKIGQGLNLTTDGQGVSLVNYMNECSKYSNYSMTAWVYLNSTATNHSSAILSSGDWNNGGSQCCFGFYSYNSGYEKILVPNRNNWSDGVNINSKILLNRWYHIAIAYDGSTTRAYVNGDYVGSYSGGGITPISENANLYVGRATYYEGFTLKGKLNDVRIYNHCLSDKEVKEIAKGLVLHYTFNDIFIQNTIYDSSGYRYNATLIGPEYYKMKPIIKNLLGNPSEFSLSNITNNSGDLTYTPNVLAMANYDLPTPIVGHKYYGRVEQLVPPNTSFADGRFEYFIVDAGGTGNVVFTAFSEAVQDNQWHMYSSIQQFTGLYAQSGYYMRSFSVNATNASKRRNHMIIDLTDAFGAGNEPTKEWCDKNIPYFTGTLSIVRHPDSGRGSAVLYSIGNPSAKILTTLNPSFITNGTLVVWYKKDSSAMNYNSGNFLMATQANSGQYLCATNGDSPPFNGASSYNHWYVDGIEQNKSNFMDTNWHMYSPTGINLSSWTSLAFHAHGDDLWLYRGEIAEIRLYNTELSANDIKELYETSASVDKNGNLYCREIVEV